MELLLCKVMIVLLVLKGADLYVSYLNREPDKSTMKAFEHATVVKRSLKEKLIDELLMPIARQLAVLIKMEEEKEINLKEKLARADINLSPQEYYARAIVAGALSGLIIPVLYLLGMNYLIPVGVGVIAVVTYGFLSKCQDALKAKKQKIELGLPGFIRSILYKLNEGTSGTAGADLIAIFEDYLKVADPVFHYDVSVLVMEMKSKNIETALRNFNNRVGIVEVSFLCNALIGITRGERQAMTLDTLAKDMDLKAREQIKRELEKRPAKVMMATLPLVGVAGATMVYVVIASIMTNLSKLV